MKWKDAFEHPDLVGQSEYRALHDTVADAVLGYDSPDPDSQLSDGDTEAIVSVLEEFRDWSLSLIEKCTGTSDRRVVISVRGGVAELVRRPLYAEVEIRDYDTEGCDPCALDDDGAMVSVYGEEEE